MHLAKDRSLLQVNATVTGFLCSNSRNQQDRYRHYWVVEFENGIPKYAFDSLQGKQRLTTELAKKLRVFGVLFNVGDEHVPFLRTKYLDEAAGIIPAVSRGRNPIVVLGRGRIQWARNALCKKYKASTSKKGRVQKHTLKSSRQNRQSEKSGRVRSSRGPPDGKKKGIGAHKPNKPGRKQSNTTRKTLPWLFSQASGAQVSQGHHTENNNSVFDISDDSVSEDNFEADPGGLNNDLPLSDPISEFSSLHEVSKAGDDRAEKNFIADGNRITPGRFHVLNCVLTLRKILLKLNGKLVPLLLLTVQVLVVMMPPCMAVLSKPNLANMELFPYLMVFHPLSGHSLRSWAVLQLPYYLLKTMKQYDG